LPDQFIADEAESSGDKVHVTGLLKSKAGP
jgi:hypothetical protein